MLDADECTREWPGFRRMLAENTAKGIFTDPSKEKPRTPFNMFLEWYIPGPWSAVYPCLTNLVTIAATLPVGSATVERSFSQMKLIKTRLRSTMNEDTLEWLMLIAMEGPPQLPTSQIEEVIDNLPFHGVLL